MFLVINDINVLKTIYFIKSLVNIIFILVPCLVILLSMVTFGKYIASGKSDELKGVIRIALTRLIIGVLIFFVPTVVSVVVSLFDNYNENEFTKLFFLDQEAINAEIENQKKLCSAKGDKWLWDDASSSCNENPGHVDNSSQLEANALIELSQTTNTGTNDGTGMTYYNQGDYKSVKFCGGKKTVKSSGCGATSLAMIATYFTSSSYTPKVVANWLCNTIHGGGGMSYTAFTNKKMLDKFSLSVKTLFDNGHYQSNSGKKYNESQGNSILDAVKSGRALVLYIPGHYVAVGPNTKCASDQVYLYDPGNRTNNGCYTPKKLWDRTYNNRNRCNEKNNCGWKAAFAYTKA